MIVTGIVTLAPLSNPTNVRVVFNCSFEPNNVFTVVALKLICDPITVEDTFVPNVVVDVAFDQGGCIETSKPTTHGDPTYIVDDVVHYCVANMPGGVPRTSTLALNNATLPFLVKLANKGYQKALSDDKNFLAGLNVHIGQVTYKAVAEVFGYKYVDPSTLI